MNATFIRDPGEGERGETYDNHQGGHATAGPGGTGPISERNGSGLSVFVSHASQDARIARRVAMGLRTVGYNTWFDELELSPGDSLVERINDAIATTDVLLVLLSQHSVRSRWVRRELATGIARELSAGASR